MNLYHLVRVDGYTPYDDFESFVIRADSETQARQLAFDKAIDDQWAEEGIWLDAVVTTCKAINTNGESEIILASYKRG